MQTAIGADLVWETTFGGAGDDRAFFAATAADGYVVVGSSTSFISGTTVACIVRFDQNGNQLWNKTYTENQGLEFRYICPSQDGFLVLGNTFLAVGNVDGAVFKMDSEGNPLWNVTLSESEGVNKLFSGVSDGADFVVAGLTQPQNGSLHSHAWLVKLDADGKILWSKTYGETTETAARAVTLTQDHCYVATGYVDADGNGNYDVLALKLDSDGNLLWSKTYGENQSDKAYAITSSANSCVIAGDTRSKGSGDCDAWIIKIDSAGNLLWDQTAGGSNFDSPTFIAVSSNGGYIVAGTTFSFGNGQRDFWLFKVSDEGKIMWSSTVGRSGYEEAYAAVYAGGKDYVLAGWTNSIGNGGRYDFYIVKVQTDNS
jgi:TolB-like protein